MPLLQNCILVKTKQKHTISPAFVSARTWGPTPYAKSNKFFWDRASIFRGVNDEFMSPTPWQPAPLEPRAKTWKIVHFDQNSHIVKVIIYILVYCLDGKVCIKFGAVGLLLIYRMVDNTMEFLPQTGGLNFLGRNSMVLSIINPH